MTFEADVANFRKVPVQTLDFLLSDANARGLTEHARVLRAAINRSGNGHNQTQELANCGRLFPHNETIADHNGLPLRAVTRFTGDIAAFMAPFMSGATVGRIDKDCDKIFQTVALRNGERVQVVPREAAA